MHRREGGAYLQQVTVRRTSTSLISTGCARSRCTSSCCSTRASRASPAATSASTCSSCCRAISSRSCLLRDIARAGSIRFGRFYSRRFRRLLPAAFVALIVTASCSPRSRRPSRSSTRSDRSRPRSCTSANWYFIHQSTRLLRRRHRRRTRCCTSGRWRSRSSSTCCGR